MKKKLYLANPYGFSKQTKNLLFEFINIFNALDVEVYEPFERTKNIIQKEGEWAYELAKSNYEDLKKCDCIFAIVMVVAWNFGYPEASPLEDVVIAVILSLFSTMLKKLLKF